MTNPQYAQNAKVHTGTKQDKTKKEVNHAHHKIPTPHNTGHGIPPQ